MTIRSATEEIINLGKSISLADLADSGESTIKECLAKSETLLAGVSDADLQHRLGSLSLSAGLILELFSGLLDGVKKQTPELRQSVQFQFVDLWGLAETLEAATLKIADELDLGAPPAEVNARVEAARRLVFKTTDAALLSGSRDSEELALQASQAISTIRTTLLSWSTPEALDTVFKDVVG